MIGLFFGDTDFPNKILKTIKKRKIKYLIIDLSKSKKFKKDNKSYSVSIGQFGKIINILKENNCRKVLFAGKVNKPNFSKLRLDIKGIYFQNGDYDTTGNGIVYFDTTGKQVGAAGTAAGISTSNFVLTTNAAGIPKWTDTLDGGTF